MTGTTRDILRSIVDRILRLKEEQDALGADIREVYAEAKSQGFDKTALGQTVSILRNREKDPAAFDERSALVDLYLTSLGEPQDRGRTGTRERAREIIEEFPSGGESRERQTTETQAAMPARSVSKSEAPSQPRNKAAGTAAQDDDFPDMPTFLRRGHPDCFIREDHGPRPEIGAGYVSPPTSWGKGH